MGRLGLLVAVDHADQTNVEGILGPNLPTATSPDAVGNAPFTGLSSGDDVSGLWLKK